MNNTSHQKQELDGFLLREYGNIAQAHHMRIETILSYFRHYLLIVSLPIPLIPLVMTLSRGREPLMNLGKRLALPGALGGSLIGVVGFFIMGYVITLRTSALLYARTINGIRDYFATKVDVPEERLSSYLVLPRDISFLPYREWATFGFVVYALSALDAAYFGLGGWIVIHDMPAKWWILPAGLFLVASFVHIKLYCSLTRDRNTDDHVFAESKE